jgi:hypothetical protein
MTPRKRFKEYAELTPINESSWLSKGFGLGQGNRHAATVRQLDSLVGKIKTECSRGKQEDDATAKINLLFEVMSDLALGFKLGAELSRANINVAIASNLLEDDLRALIAKSSQRK